jgi:hypothetical protein
MRHLTLSLLLLLSFCLPARAQPQFGADTVVMSGFIGHPLQFVRGATPSIALKSGPAHQLRNGKGEVKKTIPAFKGYLLKDILEKAEPVMPEHKEQGKYIVVVTASDGYTVVFSYNELVNGPAGNGAWLIPVSGMDQLKSDGPFVLICASDTVSAPRYVKWVKSIELRKI